MKFVKGLALCMLVLLILPGVFALKGVGLKYGTTGEIIKENQQTCVPYGVYNPWDEDLYIKLEATGELANFTTTGESVFVPAQTFNYDALPINLCFDIEEVYEKDCILYLACEKKCPTENIEFNGIIMATEDKPPGVGGTGSATSVSAAAPLKLVITCEEEERNWTPLIVLFVAIAVLIIALIRVKMIMKKPRKRRKRR